MPLIKISYGELSKAIKDMEDQKLLNTKPPYNSKNCRKVWCRSNCTVLSAWTAWKNDQKSYLDKPEVFLKLNWIDEIQWNSSASLNKICLQKKNEKNTMSAVKHKNGSIMLRGFVAGIGTEIMAVEGGGIFFSVNISKFTKMKPLRIVLQKD